MAFSLSTSFIQKKNKNGGTLCITTVLNVSVRETATVISHSSAHSGPTDDMQTCSYVFMISAVFTPVAPPSAQVTLIS